MRLYVSNALYRLIIVLCRSANESSYCADRLTNHLPQWIEGKHRKLLDELQLRCNTNIACGYIDQFTVLF